MIRRALCLSIVLVLLAAAAEAGEILRFDFQQYQGEGGYELYRIDVDMAKKTGSFCYLTTAWSGIPDEIVEKFGKKKWSAFVDLKTQEHACFDFDLYNYGYDYGWFFSPEVKYGGEGLYELSRFFFTGEIKKRVLKGTLHYFRDLRAGKESYKSVDQYDISVRAETIKN